MRHRSVHAVVLWVVMLGLFQSRQAFAQGEGRLQLGAGYQFLHESLDRGGADFPVGAYVDIEHVVASDRVKAWSWMGQVEAGFRSDDGFSEQFYTFLGGLRLARANPTRWMPSGFGLLGVGTANTSCDEYCAGSTSGFAAQGGFVMTTRVNSSMLVDIAFKATKLTIDGSGLFNAAVAAGVRFNLGSP